MKVYVCFTSGHESIIAQAVKSSKEKAELWSEEMENILKEKERMYDNYVTNEQNKVYKSREEHDKAFQDFMDFCENNNLDLDDDSAGYQEFEVT